MAESHFNEERCVSELRGPSKSPEFMHAYRPRMEGTLPSFDSVSAGKLHSRG